MDILELQEKREYAPFIAVNRDEVKAQNLIEQIAYFHKLFTEKNVGERFEPFMKDCINQATQKAKLQEFLTFPLPELPSDDIDIGMGVIPETETEQEVPQDENTENKQENSNTDIHTDNEMDSNDDETTNQSNGSDSIRDTDITTQPDNAEIENEKDKGADITINLKPK